MKQIPYGTIMAYRDLFLRTDLGREVLHDILNDLYVFADRLENDEQRIMRNAGQIIVSKLGIGPGHGTIPDLIAAYASIIPPPPKDENNGRDD